MRTWREPTKGTLTLMKNTWGYMPIQIRGGEDSFHQCSRPEISTEDFVGNAHEIEYVVRPEQLHGRTELWQALKFVTPYETLSYEIEVLQNQKSMTRIDRIPELLKRADPEGIYRLCGGTDRTEHLDRAARWRRWTVLRKSNP
ncbi:MAG: DUF5717 family protein [[Clostridium] scindens]